MILKSGTRPFRFSLYVFAQDLLCLLVIAAALGRGRTGESLPAAAKGIWIIQDYACFDLCVRRLACGSRSKLCGLAVVVGVDLRAEARIPLVLQSL